MYPSIGEKNRRLSHALAYGTFLFHYTRILLLCVYGFYFTTISSFGLPPRHGCVFTGKRPIYILRVINYPSGAHEHHNYLLLTSPSAGLVYTRCPGYIFTTVIYYNILLGVFVFQLIISRRRRDRDRASWVPVRQSAAAGASTPASSPASYTRHVCVTATTTNTRNQKTF